MAEFAVFAEKERSGWADPSIVAAYVSKFGPVVDAVSRRLVAHVAPSGGDVLDLCCGHGTLTRLLVEAGADVSGLDFSAEMLARARRSAPGARLSEGDAAALPYETASFDSVLCNFGMMHLPDPPAALAEIRRVLRPDGRFLMATWAAPDRSPAFGTVFGTIRALADMSFAPVQPDLFAFSRPEDARGMLARADLQMTLHEDVEEAWVLQAPSELFDIYFDATVGARMLIMSQSPETVDAIRERMSATVAERFADGNVWRVPVPVTILEAVPA